MLVLLYDALRAREEGVTADAPGLAARKSKHGQIAQRAGSEQQLSGSRERGMSHFTTYQHLLHAELECSLQCHRRRHGDHGPRLRGDRAAHGQLNRYDRVRVPVRDAVGAAVESSHVV